MAYSSTLALVNQPFRTVNRNEFMKPTASALMKQQIQQKMMILNSTNGSVICINGAGILRVAYQGVPGAYSEFAAITACPGCITIPCRTFTDAITALKTGSADRFIVPVESTMEGTTLRNYDLLLQHNLLINQEINTFVHYCLLALPGVQKAELKRVISHPMALAHCSRALAQLGVDREAVEDTAGAVEFLLSDKLLDTAAIASLQAAQLYGLNVLAHGLQDESWNVTRFLILAEAAVALKDNQLRGKTSMVIGHHTGTLSVLLKVLSAFSSRNINLMKLEVNPQPNKDGYVMVFDVQVGSIKGFPYALYVDFEGSMGDQKVKDAIAEISVFPVFVRILGSYNSNPKIHGFP